MDNASVIRSVESQSQKKIVLIDGYGFVFRAYHSLPPLTRSDGTPVGAVYGFTNMLIKLLAGIHASHIAVVFDAGSKTFRNEIYPEYKAHRPPCPQDLIPQFAIVREAAESLNLAVLEKVGVEADDIIATLAKKYAREDFEVVIVSSDKDLMQLVSRHVSMYDAMKNKIIKSKEVEEKFAVLPDRVLDVLSLIGDASDNIPGVKGIGPKTAAELILQFGSLEKIFENLDKIKQDKRRELLQNGVENAKLSKILLALKEDVEINITLDEMEVKAIDAAKLVSFLEKQGFRSLVERVKKEFGYVVESIEGENSQNKSAIIEEDFDKIKKTVIDSEEKIKKFEQQIKKSTTVIIDYHANNDILFSLTVSSVIANKIEEIFYCDISNLENKSDDLFSLVEKKSTHNFSNNFLQYLAEIFLDNSIKKIFFDSKNFLRAYFFTCHKRLQIKAFEDVVLMNHLLNSSTKNDFYELVKMSVQDNLEARGFDKIFTALAGDKPSLELENQETRHSFFAFKNYALWQLYKILSPQIFQEKLNNSYQNYEKPLLPILADIEIEGIKIDAIKLHNLSQEFASRIAAISAEIYKIAGQEFNIASPKQLGEILFEKMQIESAKKSKKTGTLSTNSEVLEELSCQGFTIADKVLEFRKLSKLKNTYTDSLPKEINEETGRIHTHFSTSSTSTGRLSSNNPNLQNIPIKSEEGKKIREAFIAKKDHLLIAADYSQIELRVIAQVAKIENLIEAFKNNKDIHRITAAQVFGLKEEDVTDEIRSKAKAINFGIIYGISGFGLARQLKISRKDAREYIKSYLESYPGIDSYMKSTIEFARQNGFVNMISGRKCFIRGINDKNPIIRAEAERLAINAPIQGSAADIIKKAMIALDKKLREKFTARLILQIHDELIIEAPQDNAKEISDLVKMEMENALKLDVPLKVDVVIAKNWS